MDFLTNISIADTLIDGACLVMLVFLTRLGLKDRADLKDRIHSLEGKLDSHFDWKKERP